MTKFAIEQDQPVAAFSRASVAYDEGEQVAIDIAREQTRLLPATPTLELLTDKGPGSVPMEPLFAVGDVLYGIVGTAGSRLYKSVDNGDNWVTTGLSDTAIIYAKQMRTGTIIARTSARAILRSTNNGESWATVTPTEGLTAGAMVRNWTLNDGNGTIMMSEYTSGTDPFSANNVWRSVDDGLTWTRVLDLTWRYSNEASPDYDADDGTYPQHIHTINYHAGSGRWLLGLGDGTRRRILFSADNGDTWADLTPFRIYGGQPVVFWDYGHPTKILAGSDNHETLQLLTVSGDNAGQWDVVWADSAMVANTKFVFSLGYYGGLYYAFLSSTASRTDRAILVSRDAETWQVAYRFSEAMSYAANQLTYCDGKLHWFGMVVGGTNAHIRFSPAKIAAATGTVVTPVRTNLLSADNSSFAAGLGNWAAIGGTNGADTPTRVTTNPYAGTHCMKVSMKAEPGNAEYRLWPATNIALTEYKTYVARCRVRTSGGGGQVRLSITSTAGVLQTADWRTGVNGDKWTMAVTEPFTAPEGGYNCRVHLNAYWGSPQPYPDLFVDAVELIELPAGVWQIGGTAQAAEVLTETVTPGKVWTDVFAVTPLAIAEYYAAAAMTIKTWALDADNKIDILYDPTDAKFKLRRTIDGTPEDTVDSAAQYWHGNACIKFVLRVSGAACSLTIQNGRAAETLDDDGMPDLLDAEIVGTYGDFPMVVLTGWNRSQFVPLWIADTDVVKVMALTTPDYTKVGTAAAPDVFSGVGVF